MFFYFLDDVCFRVSKMFEIFLKFLIVSLLQINIFFIFLKQY